MKKTTSPKRLNYKNASWKKSSIFKTRWIISIAILLLLVVGGWIMNRQPGPINAAISRITGTPPLAQQDNTRLYTAKGLASSSTILVKFKSSASSAMVTEIHKQNKASVKQTIASIGVQEVSLPAGTQVGAALDAYRSHAEVEYAEPDFIAQGFMTPNDTLFPKQWNLAKINAPTAWDDSQGGYGPIAIIDTGIDAAHSDLAGEVTGGYNFVNDSTDTNDDNGHGTHVAGIIAGTTNNGNGVASIGLKSSLLPVKVLDSSGSGTYADVANGIVYAADNGAKIINLSLGGSSNSKTLATAVSYAEQRGVIVVAAAGNNGNNAAVYPADYPGVIAVAATTDSDTLASFSSYGSNIFLSAPGVNIISTYNDGGYAQMSGTSMAAPEVAGLISLALAHGQVTASTVLDDLKQTSDKVGPYAYDSNGWNQYFGYGRIDATKLLQMIAGSPSSPVTTTPEPAPTANGQTIHGQPNLQFSVDFEGSIDSIDPNHGMVVVKIQSISQNLKIADSNLVNVYINDTTKISFGNQTLSLSGLSAGDKLSGKALWQNNQVTATELKVQGRANNQQRPSQATSHPQGRRP